METTEHDEGFYFGRAHFSISFDCPGTPWDYKAYRAMVFQLPAIQRIKAELEEVVGRPLLECVHW